MRYALIRKMDISNGKGIGVALFLQGCHFHCKGCFNQETWDFNGGKEWTDEIESKFLELLNPDYITRLSILGGEPMEKRNIKPLIGLINHAKAMKPSLRIWIYTGYILEDLMELDSDDFPVKQLLSMVDYLVDGQFELDKQDVNHVVQAFAGSTNQRVINLRVINLNEMKRKGGLRD